LQANPRYKIVVLPGDGIGLLIYSLPMHTPAHLDTGPEVIAQAVRVLEAVAEKSAGLFQLNLETHVFGGAAIDATGDPLPKATLEAAKSADAILMGTVIYFEVGRSELTIL
jgi:3-isopropylmalate dehydrogenase